MDINSLQNQPIKTFWDLLDSVVSLFVKERDVLILSNLSESIQSLEIINNDSFPKIKQIIPLEKVSIRYFVTELLENLGVFLAFSGKNDLEKAVIIDTDDEYLTILGIPLEHFKLGQTIIRNISEKKGEIFTYQREKITSLLNFALQYVREQIAIRNTINYI